MCSHVTRQSGAPTRVHRIMDTHAVMLSSLLVSCACASRPDARPAAAPLERIAVIDLPGVEGRIDHLALDAATQRLFVAALENDSLEVVDLALGRHERSITRPCTPSGVAYAPEISAVLLANGSNGLLEVYPIGTYDVVSAVAIGPDVDNVRWDGPRRRVVVGYGAGALAVVEAQGANPSEWRVSARIELGGPPESFQLTEGGAFALVNVPDAHALVRVDLGQSRVAKSWDVRVAERNYALAYDAARDQVLIGCRQPPRLLVYGAGTDASGLIGTALELSGDVDDLYFDERTQRLYASCGAGFLDVFERRTASADTAAARSWIPLARIPSAAGARTSLFSPEMRRLYLAVPHRGEQRAAIWVYAAPDVD